MKHVSSSSHLACCLGLVFILVSAYYTANSFGEKGQLWNNKVKSIVVLALENGYITKILSV